MKYLKRIIGILLLAVVPALALSAAASAQRFTAQTDKGETVHSSVYASGSDVQINGTIYGDVFCLGQKVRINAVVHGDVICGGVDVQIQGVVDGDVRVAAQMANVDAQISQNATILAASFSLDASANVGQDLTATGNNLNIKGKVGRDAVLSGEGVTLNGHVGRNVTAQGTRIELKHDAHVVGNVTYTSRNNLAQDSGSRIMGDAHKNVPAKQHYTFRPTFYLFMLLGLTLVSIALTLLFPRYLQATSRRLTQSFPKTFAIGVALSVALPAVALALLFTVVGIPLVAVLTFAILFAAALTGPIVSYFVGQLIFRKSKKVHPITMATVGSVILVTLYFVPVVGQLVMVLVCFMGMGAILVDLQGRMRAPKAQTKE